jgi:hypothetical protein
MASAAVAGDQHFVCVPYQQEGLGQLRESCVVVHKQNDSVRHGSGLHPPRNACLVFRDDRNEVSQNFVTIATYHLSECMTPRVGVSAWTTK